ncbi:nitrogen fixation protein NifQ [Paucibacter sp. R3-3]|uniref:Nitrogen fixation protein NifQ n=1 Tax=Roseateles agri TaxID=3098619 RepID=A0ABU5DEC7_9BURK|nr:nitrogen fixation protein NifQ [Paucibacter sp. R3-3]MDY0744635.1 nitrogen fixation protein NifQ [Paucibacter sp. R3-3]
MTTEMISAADRQLLQRAVQHFRAAAIEGELPSLRSAEAAGALPEEWRWLMPLHRLLLAHLDDGAPELAILAEVLACACMGRQHLWQDLGLSGRGDVSRLMALAFPRLFRSNVRDLRWKRHLFLSLGQTLGLPDLQPPRCDECDTRASCLGAPAAVPVQLALQR